MNYRGAKVNISGEITKAELHSAWLKLQGLKLRGQQYMKGNNFFLISDAGGDIINITGRLPRRKQEEPPKEEKRFANRPVTAVCFVYDVVSGGNYTGNNIVAGISGMEKVIPYNVAGSYANPLTAGFPVAGASLTELLKSSYYPNFTLTTGPETYTFSDGVTTYNTTRVYSINRFFSLDLDKTHTSAFDDFVASPAMQRYVPFAGGASSAIYWNGGISFDITVTVLTLCTEAEDEIPANIYASWQVSDAVEFQEICNDIAPAMPGEGLTGDTAYQLSASFPNFVIAQVEAFFGIVGAQPSGYFTSDTSLPSPTIVNQAYAGYLGYIGYRYYPSSQSLQIPVLPDIGVPGGYTDTTISYTSVTKLDVEEMIIYLYGIPQGFHNYVVSDTVDTLCVKIGSDIVYQEALASDTLEVKQADIYKLVLDEGNVYFFIVYLTKDAEDLHLVYRKNTDGSIDDLSEDFDVNYSYMRVAEVSLLLKKEI